MIISAEPMASGGRKLSRRGAMTVMPTVRTRKNVPMNSTRYFFMVNIFLCHAKLPNSANLCQPKKQAGRLHLRHILTARLRWNRFNFPLRSTARLALVIVRAKAGSPGAIKLTATPDGLAPASIKIKGS